MSTEIKHERRKTRHGFWFGLWIGGLLGAVVSGGLAFTGSPVLAAKALGHGFRGHGLQDPEIARERAEFAARFILERVDATEDQRAEVKRVVSETIDALVPLAAAHRANRDALHTEIGSVEVDPDAIERIRQSEMELAEAASREVTEALTAFAQALTAEQRNELIEMAHRLHR